MVQCIALLKHHIPDFDIEDVEKFLHREGIELDPALLMGGQFPFAPPASNSPPQSMKGYPYHPPIMHPYGHMVPPGYPPPPLNGGPYPPMVPPGMYNPHIHPAFQPHPHMPPPPPPSAADSRALTSDIKGQDPQSNDMSNAQASLFNS